MRYVYQSVTLKEAFKQVAKDGHSFTNSKIKCQKSRLGWSVEVKRVGRDEG